MLELFVYSLEIFLFACREEEKKPMNQGLDISLSSIQSLSYPSMIAEASPFHTLFHSLRGTNTDNGVHYF